MAKGIETIGSRVPSQALRIEKETEENRRKQRQGAVAFGAGVILAVANFLAVTYEVAKHIK